VNSFSDTTYIMGLGRNMKTWPDDGMIVRAAFTWFGWDGVKPAITIVVLTEAGQLKVGSRALVGGYFPKELGWSQPQGHEGRD
jgi:hypothetical protein